MLIERVELVPREILGVHEVVPLTDLTDFFSRAFQTSAMELARQGLIPAGPPVALYHGDVSESDDGVDTVDVTAGFPIEHQTVSTAPAPGTVVEELPGGEAAETVHSGSYDSLSATYSELTGWLARQQLTPGDEMWEEYLIGPESNPDPHTWQTRVVFPLAHA